jgi:EAL domain-containing protein (putative c-di-GMP-specific phosphodiesterase class I)
MQVAQLLVRQGVQKLQGYYFGQPMSIGEFVEWVRGRERGRSAQH